MAKILVVDDSPSVLSAVIHSLRDVGHTVIGTNSGEDAICLLKSNPSLSLLILDMAMPGLDGLDVLHSINKGSIPVIVITGHVVSAEELSVGKIKRVLMKPFNQDQLLMAVDDALNLKSEKEG